MWGRKLVTATVIAGLAFGGASASGGVLPPPKPSHTRTYRLTFSGGIVESYTRAAPTSPIDCAISEQGDIIVFWRDVWKVKLGVFPESEHVRVLSVKRVSGPVDAKHVGGSEIQGTNSDEAGDTLDRCSKLKEAGKYDCQTERVRPVLSAKAVPQFVRDGKSYVVSVAGFALTKAHYTGPSPKNFTCAKSAGTDFSPGGAIGLFGLGEESTAAPARLNDSTVFGLGVGQAVHAHHLSSEGDGWDTSIPAAGDDCRATDETPGTCSYVDPLKRAATFEFKRIG
jgi:hypothetical protein